VETKTNQELTMIARDIMQTTGTPGWHRILELAQRALQNMVKDAIDAEDDVKGSQLRREAKAAKTFLENFLTKVEAAKQYLPPDEVPEETLESSDAVVEPEGFDSNPL
jgi:hypothetical protein